MAKNSFTSLLLNKTPLDHRIDKEQTLLDLISEQDPPFATWLKDAQHVIEHLYAQLRDNIRNFPPDHIWLQIAKKITETAMPFVHYTTLTLAVAQLIHMVKLCEKLQLLRDTLSQPQEISFLDNEITLAQLLLLEYPFYENHARNFMERLQRNKNCLTSPLTDKLITLLMPQQSPANNSQSWLLEPLALFHRHTVELNLKPPLEGHCAGYARMLILSLETNELPTFLHHINLLNRLNPDELQQLARSDSDTTTPKTAQTLSWTDYQSLKLFLSYIAKLQQHQGSIQRIAAEMMPHKKNAKLHQVINHTYCYDFSDLLAYLQQLRALADSTTSPCRFISLELSSSKHMIAVAYDCHQQQWIFGDANTQPQNRNWSTTSDWLITIRIMAALFSGHSDLNIRVINTVVYSTEEHLPLLMNYVNRGLAHHLYKHYMKRANKRH